MRGHRGVACAVGALLLAACTSSADPPARTRSPGPPSASVEASTATTSSSPPGRPAVVTPQGMWWGVDSSGPITPAAIANVRGWYRGHPRPQFWGRYLSGDYGVSRAELAYARAQGIYVYLIVNDRNCSECAGGGDICGNDMTAPQARADAREALRAARRLGLGRGTVLFKDIEQVSSCRGEPTAAYLDTWYRTLKGTDWVTGFYGNAYTQNYDFPRGYCATVAKHPDFGRDVILDMNEDEPLIGAPRGRTGPGNAPRFMPLKPACAPRSAVVIWQYGESTSAGNYTDIDQARPGTPGLLAPDGTVTG